MRKISFAKYKDTIKEIVPKANKVNEITCQRRMFCTMINQYLSKKSQFDLKNSYSFNNSLLHIFEDKIMSFFQFYKFRPERPQKVTHFYIQDSLVLNQYFKQSQNKKMRFMSKRIHFDPEFRMMLGYLHPAIDLIQLIFNGKETEMMLDLNEIFTRTLYNRIEKEENKKVTLNSSYIHITQDGIKTMLHPRWKYVYPQNLKAKRSDINTGFSQLQDKEIS